MKRILLVLVLAGLVAGCGDPVEVGDKKPSIAVIPKGLTHEFWLTVKAGAETAGEEFGVEIIWQGPAKETDVEKQMSIVDAMINRNIDAIVMAACDENALVPKVELAMAKGIPVVTIDSGVKSDAPVSFVATDNVAGAKKAADFLAELIGGEGKVGCIPFVPGAATSQLREKGFKEGIAAYPNIELVATLYSMSNASKGMEVTQDMLTANPDIKGIFAANEPGAIGAGQAIKLRQKIGDVKVVAFDASEPELQALQEGVIQALIVQNPFKMGYEGVKAAVDAMNGKEVPKRIDTGVTVVTMDNLDTPEVQKLLNPLD